MGRAHGFGWFGQDPLPLPPPRLLQLSLDFPLLSMWGRYWPWFPPGSPVCLNHHDLNKGSSFCLQSSNSPGVRSAPVE